jgi:hypothetical protein
MDETLWVGRVGVPEGVALDGVPGVPEGAALDGVPGATSDLTNGAKACFEDCSSLKLFKVCVSNRKPSWRNIITWHT